MYTNKLLKRLKMNNCNLIRLLISAGTVLQPNTKDPLDHNKAIVYRQIVGSTIYLANCTRPNISYVVGQLARFMVILGQSHYRLSKQLLRYLSGTRETGITYFDRPIYLPLCKIKLTSFPASYTIFTDAT
jgi:hypothetical protein